MKYIIALKEFSETDNDATEFVWEAATAQDAIMDLVSRAEGAMTYEQRQESCFWLAIVEPASEACLYCGTFVDDKAVLICKKFAARFGVMLRDGASQYPELFATTTVRVKGVQ